MIPGFGFMQGFIQIRKVAGEEKKFKAAKEKQRAKECGAKSINLYAEILSKSKPVKVEPDITITKEQARAILCLIDFYFEDEPVLSKRDGRRYVSDVDEKGVKIIMGELSALIGGDYED